LSGRRQPILLEAAKQISRLPLPKGTSEGRADVTEKRMWKPMCLAHRVKSPHFHCKRAPERFELPTFWLPTRRTTRKKTANSVKESTRYKRATTAGKRLCRRHRTSTVQTGLFAFSSRPCLTGRPRQPVGPRNGARKRIDAVLSVDQELGLLIIFNRGPAGKPGPSPPGSGTCFRFFLSRGSLNFFAGALRIFAALDPRLCFDEQEEAL
jgi:hypothetical protein